MKLSIITTVYRDTENPLVDESLLLMIIVMM